MYKKIIVYLLFCLIVFICACSVLFDFNKSDDNLDTIRVSEVAHSIFYAPMYAAIENGYYEDEGINIDLFLSSGVNKII